MVAEAELQLARLSKMGDSLEKINASIEWEIFREPIQRRIRKPNSGKGGRPPWDEILIENADGDNDEWKKKQELANKFIEPALGIYFTKLGVNPFEGVEA